MKIQTGMLSFKADEEMFQAFETYATQTSANRSELLRGALRQFLASKGILVGGANTEEKAKVG